MLAERLIGSAVSWGSRQMQKRVPYSPSNPYLEGAFAPVKTETTVTRLAVRGSIPKEPRGILTRIGPNPLEVPNPAIYHWFTGDGMVHGVRLRDGVAEWYRNRWVGTDSVNQRLGRPMAPGPRHGVSDVVNTNVLGHAGSLWALVEAGAMPVPKRKLPCAAVSWLNAAGRTSSIRSTRMKVNSSRTSCGTSLMSFSFAFGKMMRRIPAR